MVAVAKIFRSVAGSALDPDDAEARLAALDPPGPFASGVFYGRPATALNRFGATGAGTGAIYETRRASRVRSIALSAPETGQPALARSACSWKAASEMPGTLASSVK